VLGESRLESVRGTFGLFGELRVEPSLITRLQIRYFFINFKVYCLWQRVLDIYSLLFIKTDYYVMLWLLIKSLAIYNFAKVEILHS
jgi:hypothetical protein